MRCWFTEGRSGSRSRSATARQVTAPRRPRHRQRLGEKQPIPGLPACVWACCCQQQLAIRRFFRHCGAMGKEHCQNPAVAEKHGVLRHQVCSHSQARFSYREKRRGSPHPAELARKCCGWLSVTPLLVVAERLVEGLQITRTNVGDMTHTTATGTSNLGTCPRPVNCREHTGSTQKDNTKRVNSIKRVNPVFSLCMLSYFLSYRIIVAKRYQRYLPFLSPVHRK